jgi:hypothetical protein
MDVLITKSGEGSNDVDAEGNEIEGTSAAAAGKSPRPNVTFSPEIAPLRAVVERAFGRLKNWAVMTNSSHSERSSFVTMFTRFLCALSHWLMEYSEVTQL